MSKLRQVSQIINGIESSDGDGVQLTRVIGTPYLDMLDPFLLFDAFGSDKPQDYIGGFPSHPHRGFETVTYMLEGKMRHKDSAGNEGIISAGGVQWMTAGRGIIHSEMPEQQDGMLAGFQLWVNLPATNKMDTPKYQEYEVQDLPTEIRADGTRITVIAGKTRTGVQGVIDNDFVNPTYWDVRSSKQLVFEDQLPDKHNGFVYVISGSVLIGDSVQPVETTQIAILTDGEAIKITSQSDETRFLVIAGLPLNQSVARGGPFVMNTRAEIEQAFQDYSQGRFT